MDLKDKAFSAYCKIFLGCDLAGADRILGDLQGVFASHQRVVKSSFPERPLLVAHDSFPCFFGFPCFLAF